MSDWQIFSHPWFYTLGLTLLHSLWQGALIAALLGLALRVYRDRPARLRYGLTVTAMLLWFGAAAVTFAVLMGETGPQHIAAAIAGAAREGSFTLSGLLEGRFDPAALVPIFMLFWLSGVAFMSLRTAIGLYGVFSLRRRDIFPLSGEWRQKIGAWLDEWGVKRAIPIYLSARVQVPVVAGFFKQSLLIPLSFLTSFPPEQVQAILAHEVAHFLRRDALVNLLQTILEILFFYHPAVWWISARMRDEREYCCDDYAVAKCGRPMLLARALVDLQKLQVTTLAQAPVLSAAGSLQARIKRLFNLKENAMEMREKLLALLFLIGLGLVLVPLQSISKNAGMPDDDKKKIKKIEVRVEQEGDDENVFTVTTSDSGAPGMEKMMVFKDNKGEEHIIKIKNGKTVSVTKDGKEIPLDSLKEDMRHEMEFNWQMDDDEDKVITFETSGADSAHKHVTVKVLSDDDDSAIWHVTGDNDKIITIKSDGDSTRKMFLVKVSEGDKELRKAQKDSIRKEIKIIRERDHAGKDNKGHDKVGEKIRSELAKDRIIAGGNAPVEFKLTEKELVVNGVKQSDDAHKKYKKILSKRMGLDDDEKLEIKLKFNKGQE